MPHDDRTPTINDGLPKSRITLTYRTKVNGQFADKELPFRLLLLGDFSKGTSKDARVVKVEKDGQGKEVTTFEKGKRGLEERNIRNLAGKTSGKSGTSLDAMMKDMDMKLEFQVRNAITPEGQGTSVTQIPVKLPITAMKSFSPLEVANNIPQVRALLLLRKLLTEVQANLDNSKTFRDAMREMSKDPAIFTALKKELTELQPQFANLGLKLLKDTSSPEAK
jgi:type VI secretion system protein ImpB